MEIQVLQKEKDFFEFILKGERHTFPNLLREALLQDSKVEFAAYKLEHPLDNQAKFVVRTNSKTAVKALNDALKLVESNLSELEDAVKKTFKE